MMQKIIALFQQMSYIDAQKKANTRRKRKNAKKGRTSHKGSNTTCYLQVDSKQFKSRSNIYW